MAAPKVGSEVDAFCTRCKLTLRHTILALVGTKIARVRCNTCQGDHAFRSAPGSRASASAGSRGAARAKPNKKAIAFEELLATKDVSKARMYSPRDTYVVAELINHPSFGLGFVAAIRHDGSSAKVDVTFKMTQKTLVHARSEAAGAKPMFAPPRAASQGPADKPMGNIDPSSEGGTLPEVEA